MMRRASTIGLAVALTVLTCGTPRPSSAESPRPRRHLRTATGPGSDLTIMLPGDVPLVLVRIPAGTFTMGTPEGERGRYPDETAHQVTLTRDFYLGRYEVTQRQWKAVMGTNPSSFLQCGLDCPVEQVTWSEVCGGATGASCAPDSFIGRVNQLLGTTAFRLPTEAEWERAARAGTSTEFSFAAPPEWDLECASFTEADTFMWWCGNAAAMPHPVGGKAANAYRLYDMHGNVWEWVADFYGVLPADAQVDPTGPETGAIREYRGGSFINPAKQCRSSNRGDTTLPDERKNTMGFRLARSL